MNKTTTIRRPFDVQFKRVEIIPVQNPSFVTCMNVIYALHLISRTKPNPPPVLAFLPRVFRLGLLRLGNLSFKHHLQLRRVSKLLRRLPLTLNELDSTRGAGVDVMFRDLKILQWTDQAAKTRAILSH
jgi:hypothetical protein